MNNAVLDLDADLKLSVVSNSKKQAMVISLNPWRYGQPTSLVLLDAEDCIEVKDETGRIIGFLPHSAKEALSDATSFAVATQVLGMFKNLAAVAVRWEG